MPHVEGGHAGAPPSASISLDRRRWWIAAVLLVAFAAATGVAVWLLGAGERSASGNTVSASALQEMDMAVRDAQRGEQSVTGAFLADPMNARPDPTVAFTEDVVWEDWGVRFVGIDAVTALLQQWAMFGPQSVDRDRYVGRSGGVVTDATWNIFGWTKGKPGGGVYEYRIRDGRLASVLTLLELGVLTPETANAMQSRLNPALVRETRMLPLAYARAWSSGEPAAIARLYSTDALREDEVFGHRQEGRDEIADFGARLSGWYPGARFTVVRSYGVGSPAVPGRPVNGIELTIDIPASGGDTCTVRAAVMLETKSGLVRRERVYYDPASLAACGWIDS